MFGRTVSEYLGFQKVFLALIAAVGFARLALSLTGLPDVGVRWLSMNAVGWAGACYYGDAVYTSGFGTSRQILPLAFFHIVVQQAISVLGILLSIAGLRNIFSAPEFSFGVQNQWVHLLSHLTIGIVVPPLLIWGVASLVMLVTKRV